MKNCQALLLGSRRMANQPVWSMSMLNTLEKVSMTKSVKISEQDLSRKDVALSLIKSFKEVKSVEGYKEDRRHINSEIASQLLKLNYHGQRNVKMDMVNTLT